MKQLIKKLSQFALTNPSKNFIVEYSTGQSLSYSQFNNLSNSLAALFSNEFKFQEPVIIAFSNKINFYILILCLILTLCLIFSNFLKISD